MSHAAVRLGRGIGVEDWVEVAVFADEEYRHLMEVARDALLDLLDLTDPGDGFDLRSAYARICRDLERDDERRWRAEEHEREAEQRARQDVWRRMRREERQIAVLDALHGDRLTIKSLTERLNRRLADGDRTVCESDVRRVVMRMLALGQLDRVSEPFRGKVRHRYFCARLPDGPIADLQRAYDAS